MNAIKRNYQYKIQNGLRQGKTSKQEDDSVKLAIAAVVVIILLCITLFVVGVINDFKITP